MIGKIRGRYPMGWATFELHTFSVVLLTLMKSVKFRLKQLLKLNQLLSSGHLSTLSFL